MGGITEVLTSEALNFQLSHSRKCLVSCGDKVQNFLDMDISDSNSSLPFSSKSSLSSADAESNLRPLAVGTGSWLVGDKTTQQILSVIQPTVESEHRRKEIIEYLQGLIGDAFGIKVFPFGSVPFKTYLPHGDIDLTAVSHYGTSHDLATGICSLLEDEEKNNTNISVKDVLCVPAQVRVVKCTVHGIAVDISFNQTAGLCAMYFLEQVDQFIGKDHLFKLSVILIKAWCYYESRLLGGFHGLISTYALETMVLHVINLFHPQLDSPLAVLYKFLDYYSTFDWNNYCVGINGLVLISSLPEIQVASSPNCDKLLLTEEFLRSSREPLLPSIQGSGTQSFGFPVKYLNILDPLRDDNNLGRSVSKGNFFRIRSALSYGAQRLTETMVLSPEKIGAGLEKFFINTLERNGKGRRMDVLAPVPPYGSQSSTAENGNDDLLAGIQCGPWFDNYDYGWNNGWGEVNPIMQYDHNVYYDMEESPRSYIEEQRIFRGQASSPRGLNMNNLSPEENWNSRGTPPSLGSPRGFQLNNVASNGDKWKPRRARSSVDNSRTFQLNNAAFYEDNWKSNGTLSSVDYYGGNRRKTRGTCAFIPQLAHLMQANLTMEGHGVEFENRKDEEYEMETGNFDVKENGLVVNYSMDEFPLLPGSQAIPMKPSPLAYMKCEQAQQQTVSLENSELDSFKLASPTPVSVSEVTKHSDPNGSVFLGAVSKSTVSAETLDEDNDSSKSEEKMEVSVQLADECEFPPLGPPSKPVIALCKKEFPPLRACLKSQKKNRNDAKEAKNK
ncbi:hypothetical protein vseg_021220 [Gypsophila vaccaria]